MRKRYYLSILIVMLLTAACGGASGEETPTGTVGASLGVVETPAGLPATTEAHATLLLTTAAVASQTQIGQDTTPPSTQVGVSSPSASPVTAAPDVAGTPQPVETEQAVALPKEFPDENAYTWQQVVSGLESPVGLYNAGDGTGRLFVLEQAGRIRIIADGQLLPEPFLDITDRVGSQGNEQGLLGLAFPPNYAAPAYFIVNYTDRNGDTHIAGFSAQPDNPNVADPASEWTVLAVDQPYSNHNGGDLAFDTEGLLYIALGDGGAAGDPQGNGQNRDSLLGKLLRIQLASGPSGGPSYTIPPTNPFANGGGAPEVWAFGLRNPWRFSFDLLTGDMYIGDVGQGDWEEIDFIPAGTPGGMNFGWDIMEGMECYEDASCNTQGLILPVAVTGTHDAGGCAITGGYVYRGVTLPEWQGIYLYADFCNGRVWGLRPLSVGWDTKLLYQTSYRITSFGEDESGEIYLVDRAGGVYRLEKAGS